MLLDRVELGTVKLAPSRHREIRKQREISFWKPKIKRGRRARSRGEVLSVVSGGDRASKAGVEAWNSPWPHDRGDAF